MSVRTLHWWTGFITGAFHAVSGSDHLATLLPLAVQERQAWKVGLTWGLGHGCGCVALGCIALICKHLLHSDLVSRLSDQMEMVVGLTMIFIGANGLRSAFNQARSPHSHKQHQSGLLGQPDSSSHLSSSLQTSSLSLKWRLCRHCTRALQWTRIGGGLLGVGVIHGLSGSGHLLGVLPALSFSAAATSALYLAAFTLGCMLSMSLFTHFVGRMVRWLENWQRKSQSNGLLRSKHSLDVPIAVGVVTSALAMLIGLLWLVSAVRHLYFANDASEVEFSPNAEVAHAKGAAFIRQVEREVHS